MIAATSVAAAPASLAVSPGAYTGDSVILVGNDDRRRKKGHRRHHHHRRGNDLGLGLFALGLGVFLGSTLVQPQYHGSNWDAYCSAKYKTYKPWTGTFTGYDGHEHRCR